MRRPIPGTPAPQMPVRPTRVQIRGYGTGARCSRGGWGEASVGWGPADSSARPERALLHTSSLADGPPSFTDAHGVHPPLPRFPAPSSVLPGLPPVAPPGLPGPPNSPLADAGFPGPPTHCWLELFQYTACRFPSAPPGPWASSGSSGTGTSSSSSSSGAAAIPGAAAAAAPRLSPALPASQLPSSPLPPPPAPSFRPRPQRYPPPSWARPEARPPARSRQAPPRWSRERAARGKRGRAAPSKRPAHT